MALENSEVYTVNSGKPGPKLIVMGGVHGNEVCGVQAIQKLKDEISLVCGKVTFIIANKKAIEQNVRFVEENLNRCFGDAGTNLERRTAQQLKPLLDECDALLDVHASTTPESQPFLICEPRSAGIANQLGVKTILTNIDAFHSGSTDEYMNKQNKVGICIECGYYKNPTTTRVAIRAIQTFIKLYGSQPLLTTQGLYKNTRDTFLLARGFKDFELVCAGTLIGKDGEKDVVFDRDIRILFARNTTKKNSECFLYC